MSGTRSHRYVVVGAREHRDMAHDDHSQRTKQHALRRDVNRRYPLWVYDDDDWNLMHGDGKLPVGDLICPATGCRAELVAVENGTTGTRFLRNRPGTAECGHAFGRAQGGGPPSAEHRWLQQRLAMLCDDLGYEAVQEHYESRADVWVASTPPLAIEVQRWPTAFADRSEARQSKGAKVLWLLPESASSKKAGRELFRQPAARIRVLKRGGRTEEATPWEPGHSGRVLLWVGATVMRPAPDGLTLTSAGNYDARRFLREVLEGERKWYGPKETGFAFGSGWARPEDVEQVQSARSHAASPSVPAPPNAMAQRPAPTEIKPLAAEPPAQAPARKGPDAPVPVRLGAKDFEHHPGPDEAVTTPRSDAAQEVAPSTCPQTGAAAARRGWIQQLQTWLKRGTG